MIVTVFIFLEDGREEVTKDQELQKKMEKCFL